MDPKPTDDARTTNHAMAEYYGARARMYLEAGDDGSPWAVRAAHYAGRYLDHDQPARIKIVHDQDASSPREDGNLGTFYAEHRRYQLGDKDAEDPRTLDPNTIAVALPVGMIDHSGISLYIGAGAHAQDPGGWDSGQVGVIYITREKVRQEYGWRRLTRARLEKIAGYLRSEIEVYDQHVRGDRWGFVIENADGEDLDSCWGFYGTDWKDNGMAEHWDRETAERAKAGTIKIETVDA